MKNKLLLISAMICISTFTTANANLTISDLISPKLPAYRVGISEIPENPYVQKEEKVVQTKNIVKRPAQTDINDISSYSELTIKRLSKEIGYDLECDEQEMVSDLSLLWQGAAMQSDTINFALYKLANPDADKPDKSTVKNMLKTIASMSTLVGAGISNPLLAGSSLIGANVLGIMGQDTKALNYKFSKVTDADMIILIRKVEDLQQKTVDLYYDYMNSKKQLDMISKLAQERKTRFELAQRNNVAREIIVITDSQFRSAVDKQKTARSEFLSKRATLEQFVGNEAFSQFEKELEMRENTQNGQNAQVNENYQQTISNVENYTSNLNNKTASLSGIGYVEEDTEQIENNEANVPQRSSLGTLILLDKEHGSEQKVEQTAMQSESETEKIVENTIKPKNSKKNKPEKIKKEKVKKDKIKPEKAEKPKKVKRDPYDTKGFIFLHDKQPDMNNYTDVNTQPVVNKAKNEKSKKQKTSNKKLKEVTKEIEKIDNEEILNPEPLPKPVNYHGVELLPLDEIKSPSNGYSIFAR